MGEWIDYKIRDLLTLEYGKGLDNYRSGIGKYDVFGTNGKIGLTDSFLYDKPSVIIGRKGAYREVHLAKNPFFVIDTAFYTRNKKDNLNTLYMYYWFKNVDINLMDSGSAIPSTSRDEVYDLDINLPPLSEQTAIAEVLSSLDDKIDLLHRQNKTLEQIAETLFRQWFVEEAEEGWEEKTVRDIAEHYKESINPGNYPDELFHHFSLPAYDEGRNPKLEIGKEILSNKYRVISDSILISKLNPRFPRIWAIYDEELPENSICSTEFQIVKPKSKSSFGFIYYFLKSNQVTQELANSAGGTSGSHQRVNPDDIFNLSFLLPPERLILKFHEVTKENFNKIKSNTKQIRILTQLRDTLLPKLMSGEVRVKI